MANQNRDSIKGSGNENRTGQHADENAQNHKLPDNPDKNPEELVSSRGGNQQFWF